MQLRQGLYLPSLVDCAKALNGPDDWPTSVRAALKIVGDATEATRVWIFQTISRDETHVVQDHIFQYVRQRKWAQLEEQRFRLFRSALDDPAYRRVVEGRIRGEPAAFIMDRVTSRNMRANLESQSVLSMLTAPIMVGGEWWGTLGLDECERMVDWTDTDVAYLQTLAGLIAGSIHREQRTTLTRQVTVMEQFTGSGMWELDLTTLRLWCSDTLFTMLGYPPPYAQMNIRRLARHLEPEDRDRVMAAVRDYLTGNGAGFRMDCRARRLNGESLWLELITDTARASPGSAAPTLLTGLALEASERKAREQELGQAALTDTLTGLPNRRAFQTRATRALSTTADRITLVMLDIDHFKRINDTLGHAAGDEALRVLADILRTTLRDNDLIARVGGEEFAILLVQEAREAFEVAERLRQAVAKTAIRLTDMFGRDQKLSLTVSLGLACHRTDDPQNETLHNLMGRADRALYHAKHTGRNRVHADHGAASEPHEGPSPAAH